MNEALPIVDRISERIGNLPAAFDRHGGALTSLGVNFREGMASLAYVSDDVRSIGFYVCVVIGLCAVLRFAGLFVRPRKPI